MTAEQKKKEAERLLSQVKGDEYYLDDNGTFGIYIYTKYRNYPVYHNKLDRLCWFLEYLNTCAKGKQINADKLFRLGAWFDMCLTIEANGGGTKGAYLEYWKDRVYKDVPPAMKLLAIEYAERIISNQRPAGNGYYCCDTREYDTKKPLVIWDIRLLEAVHEESWE